MHVLLAEAYVHRLDPFAIHMSGDFGVRWYGLSYAVGFLIAWGILRWVAKTNRSPLTVHGAGDMLFMAVVGVVFGGRLGYAIFYDATLFTDFDSSFPFWKMLNLLKGGMSSHGGMIGVIIAFWVFAHRGGLSKLHLFDIAGFASGPGLFLGRLANFVNGELRGTAVPAPQQANPPWWSIKYPDEVADWVENLDQEKLEALAPLRPLLGYHEGFYGRVADAVRAGDAQVCALVEPMLTAYYPSQIFQAVTDGPLLMGALSLVWLRPRKPGVIGCWFLIVYGVLRMLTEQYRQPDKGVDLLLGLSRGQTLSVVMVLFAAVTLPIVARRKVDKIGGLLSPT